nr:MAG TPA: hypothetical protein [Caudoviricetes sp.]
MWINNYIFSSNQIFSPLFLIIYYGIFVHT